MPIYLDSRIYIFVLYTYLCMRIITLQDSDVSETVSISMATERINVMK